MKYAVTEHVILVIIMTLQLNDKLYTSTCPLLEIMYSTFVDMHSAKTIQANLFILFLN